MARKKNTTRYIYLSFALALLILLIHGGKIVFNLNEFLFSQESISIRNYFTTMWYVKYDGQSVFTGMNYPYGSNIFFSDSQPLFAYLLHKLSIHYTGIEDFTILFINLLMLASIFPCIYYCYKILKYFGVGSGYASIATVLITFLSPQLANMSGDYALSYTAIIPALWYFTLKVNEKFRYINAFWIVVILLVSAGLHIDYLSLGCYFLLILALVNLVFFRQKYRIRNSAILLTCIVIAIGIFTTLLKIYDANSSIDSIYFAGSNEVGVLHLQRILLPQGSFTAQVLHQFIQYQDTPFDVRSYVGIASITILLLFSTLYNTLRQKDLDIGTGYAKYFITALLCMVIVVIVPIPTSYFGAKWYHIPSLTQVSWIFYYVFTVMAALALYRIKTYWEFRTQAVSALAVTIVLMGLWAYEANFHIHRILKPIKKEGRVAFSYIRDKEYEGVLRNNNRFTTNFQAIIALPYFNSGSGIWKILHSKKSLYSGTKVAYNLHLPIVSSYLSYVPFREAVESINLLSAPQITKSLPTQFPNQKPLLLIVCDSIHDPEELKLIAASKYLGNVDNNKLYELPLTAFDTDTRNFKSYALSTLSPASATSFDLPVKDSIAIISKFSLESLAIPLPTVTFILSDKNQMSISKHVEMSSNTNITSKDMYAIAYFSLPEGTYKLKAVIDDTKYKPTSLSVQSLILLQP